MSDFVGGVSDGKVSTHSRLKAAGTIATHNACVLNVSTHSRLKAAGFDSFSSNITEAVSTHSRLKAAGLYRTIQPKRLFCFNTQPPEGGWRSGIGLSAVFEGFNTQPPEGGWEHNERPTHQSWKFQHTAA